MPISAKMGDQVRIVSDIVDEEWRELKIRYRGDKEAVVMPCCGEPGLLKGGPGTQVEKHFAHWPNSNCDWEESTPHRLAKLIIVESCREAGFEATPEYSENDWRADVLAIKGNLRVAFEVQWSRQDMEETVRRQKKLGKDGVHGVWLFNNPPKDHKKQGQFHIFPLRHDPAWLFWVKEKDHDIPLSEFVRIALRREEARDVAGKLREQVDVDEVYAASTPLLDVILESLLKTVLVFLVAVIIVSLFAGSIRALSRSSRR